MHILPADRAVQRATLAERWSGELIDRSALVDAVLLTALASKRAKHVVANAVIKAVNVHDLFSMSFPTIG